MNEHYNARYHRTDHRYRLCDVCGETLYVVFYLEVCFDWQHFLPPLSGH